MWEATKTLPNVKELQPLVGQVGEAKLLDWLSLYRRWAKKKASVQFLPLGHQTRHQKAHYKHHQCKAHCHQQRKLLSSRS